MLYWALTTPNTLLGHVMGCHAFSVRKNNGERFTVSTSFTASALTEHCSKTGLVTRLVQFGLTKEHLIRSIISISRRFGTCLFIMRNRRETDPKKTII